MGCPVRPVRRSGSARTALVKRGGVGHAIGYQGPLAALMHRNPPSQPREGRARSKLIGDKVTPCCYRKVANGVKSTGGRPGRQDEE
eukprot:scaffold121464_cov36-Phaeocystis_antarctica.AAC.1